MYPADDVSAMRRVDADSVFTVDDSMNDCVLFRALLSVVPIDDVASARDVVMNRYVTVDGAAVDVGEVGLSMQVP